MKKFGNQSKINFLQSIPKSSIESDENDLAERCKFNFSYFTKDKNSQSFDELSEEKIKSISNKLIEFSKKSLFYWTQKAAGSSGSILAIYGAFPARTNFIKPTSVPHQAEWGRFRIDQKTRICGFIIPKKFNGLPQKINKQLFCSNTFYVVFLDENHQFYLTEKK